MDARLHVFSPVWGSHFTNLLEHALGRSFKWPLNAIALKNCIWTLLTTPESQNEILKLAHSIIPTAEIRIQTSDRLTESNAPIGALKIQALLKSIAQCLDEKTSMLMSTPDFIWADGSIQNMWDESYPDEGQGLCVSIAHMRVLPEFICDFLSPDNDEMVSRGLRHAHFSWAGGEIGPYNANGIYHSGLAWRHVPGCRMITVQHQMPSPFLVNFTESDLTEFSRWKGMTPPSFGEWDHNWPSKLIDEGRLRYIGSSDVAFMVEITEPDKNVPPLEPARTPHDQFFRSEPSVKIQKQFISTFRY
jgi:hypothetical protein